MEHGERKKRREGSLRKQEKARWTAKRGNLLDRDDDCPLVFFLFLNYYLVVLFWQGRGKS